MDELMQQMDHLERTANLSDSIQDVQRAIDLLTEARARIASNGDSAPKVLEKLKQPLQSTMEKATKDLTPMYKGLQKYNKLLDKKFPNKPLPPDELADKSELIDRAIAFHLLREGHFDVFDTLLSETAAARLNKDLPSHLRHDFADLYAILDDLKNLKLDAAMAWAEQHHAALEKRGSNLGFELCQLQYISLFNSTDDGSDDEMGGVPSAAIKFARQNFSRFMPRYVKEIQQLTGALAFRHWGSDSPYAARLLSPTAWAETSRSFTREFCALLGLSADSPLYIAATAGSIALPPILRLSQVMRDKKAEWNTKHELPVEIPLPKPYHFHSIFVCPVSREQSTDDNAPMMLPCGHVLSEDSVKKLAKGGRFKCPYCPKECLASACMKVVL